MGILSALNPFSFSRKYHAAWNALMAAYTFDQLSEQEKALVIEKAVEIESAVRRQPVTIVEITASMNEASRYYLFSLAMGNVGIRPALGTDVWFEVTNPHVDLLNADVVIGSTRHKLQKQFGVEFPELIT